MIPDDLQDQAALYVLGSLDPKERIQLEAAMRDNAELRAMVREIVKAQPTSCIAFLLLNRRQS